MKTKVTYDANVLSPLTPEQRDRLKSLAAKSDNDIDDTDIPVLSDERWKNAVQGRFYKPVKRQITARVDADVLDWLKSQGKGYQSRINMILRREMLASAKS